MKMSTAEFAKSQGITTAAATGLVVFLSEKGLITKTDEIRNPVDENGNKKRGRPSSVYEFPESLTLTF